MSSVIVALLKKITRNPWLNIGVGLIFLGTGLVEIWLSFEEGLTIGAHHGAILFGAFHALKHIPELFEAAQYIEQGKRN